MKTKLMRILFMTFFSASFFASAQITWRGNIKLNTPVTFFSMSSNPTLAGQCGMEMSLSPKVITQLNFQLGQFSNFKSSVIGKQGNFKNEFMLAGAAIGFDILSFNKRMSRKGHKLFITSGFYFMPSDIKYFKTDESVREVNITFWLNTFGVEYRYPINADISIVAFSDLFISQSAWIDGNPEGDKFDHFMNFGMGINFKLNQSRVSGLHIR